MILGWSLLVDLRRPADEQITAHALVSGINWYWDNLSGLMDTTGARCRFSPTCSLYAKQAVTRHGAARGSILAARRILRCGPWTEQGTEDPVPP